MDHDTDLKLLRDLSSDENGPTPEARTRARAALLEQAQRNPRTVGGRGRRRPRSPLRLEHIAFGLSALVAIAVVAVFLSARGRQQRSGSPGRGGVELVYQALPTPQSAVTSDALNRVVDIMRQRVDQLGVSQPEISTLGADRIVVQLPDVKDTARAEAEVGQTARLEFYDWESNALAPNGKPVAGQLLAQVPAAMAISQGGGGGPGGPGGGGGPGGPGGGGMSLYDAVKLAARQPQSISPSNARKGSEYYMFGTGGSPACAAAARLYGVAVAPVASHCLLSGGPGTTSAGSLISGLPKGVTASQGQQFAVKQGTVVLQATPSDFSHRAKIADPTTQFYVLRDHVALLGNDISNPRASTDTGGSPDVTFGFNGKGAHEFQSMTATVAHRGATLGGPSSQPLFQHFAVALDNLLITVPSIDFRTYPDGIDGSTGAQITGGFTTRSARDLAAELRDGPLPLTLKQISVRTIPARRR
jgi:SecD/SecF fusion protein